MPVRWLALPARDGSAHAKRIVHELGEHARTQKITRRDVEGEALGDPDQLLEIGNTSVVSLPHTSTRGSGRYSPIKEWASGMLLTVAWTPSGPPRWTRTAAASNGQAPT